MRQQTLAMANGFERYTKNTRRTLFLEEMEQVVPWAELCALVEPVYAKRGNGRPPVGAERMLRIYFLQQSFNLSDPGVEEALYDSAGMRQFVGIDLGREPVPDESTVCKFRHLLEEHALGERLFERVGEHLQAKGLRLSTGTIVDETIINAPSSTKNARQERDPEMHQTRKGKQWYFGMKAHVGVDSQTKLIHSVVRRRRMQPIPRCCSTCCTARRRGYGAIKPIAGKARCCANTRRTPRTLPTGVIGYKDRIDEVEREKNRTTSKVRSKVEHVFAVLKLKFGFVKVRYRGLDKNAKRLFVTCALVNLFLVRKRLLCATAA
jgi:IS5 family transposase